MTNAEKYLKDGVDTEEFIKELHLFWWFNDYDICEGIMKFLSAEAKKKKPTLTEDERVILRKVKSNYKFIGKIKILNMTVLYVSEKEKAEDFTTLTAFDYLFKFIKERRRI